MDDDNAAAWFIGGPHGRCWLGRTYTLELPLESGPFGVVTFLSGMPFAVRAVGPVDWPPQTHGLAPAWSKYT